MSRQQLSTGGGADSLIEGVLAATMETGRYLWLQQMALSRGQTVGKLVHDLAHNASLDYQQTHYPYSDPDQTPEEAQAAPSRVERMFGLTDD